MDVGCVSVGRFLFLYKFRMAQDAKSSESSAYERHYHAFSHPVKECFACWRYTRSMNLKLWRW